MFWALSSTLYYNMENINLLSPSVLAFVGDGVYGLLVRTKLSFINRPSGELHRLSVEYVKAPAQASAFKLIENELTAAELSVFKRGRNFHTSGVPKNASRGEYHTATGLETLFGYLYLDGKLDRLNYLFDIIWNKNNEEE